MADTMAVVRIGVRALRIARSELSDWPHPTLLVPFPRGGYLLDVRRVAARL
jgi:hypothetical protein